MRDQRPAVRPAFLHGVHFSPRLVGHHDLCRLHAVVLREKVQELFDVRPIVAARDAERDGTSDAVAVFNEQR